jgi:hypothetical protein
VVHVVAWLAVYALILLGINWAVLGIRERRWFKALFLPGTSIAAGVQAVSAWLCLSLPFAVSISGGGKPAFELRPKRAPVLAGGLFLFVSQSILYAMHWIAVTQFGLMDRLDAWALALPGLQPEEMLAGRIDFDSAGMIEGLDSLCRAAATHPLLAASMMYIAIGVFASLRIGPRESLWALVLFTFLGLAAYTVQGMGIDYPFWTRRFWARLLYFPKWWSVFSLFVVLAGASFIALLAVRIARLAARAPRTRAGRPHRGSASTSASPPRGRPSSRSG